MFEFGLLGPVQAYRGTTRLELGPPKQRLVLAVLLLTPNRPVPLDRLVDLTWPDSPPPTARTAIHGRISRLRAVLAATDGPDHGVSLDSEGSGYLLRVDPALVDVHRFTALLAQARAAGQDDHAVALYDRALTLWRGAPLDGVASDFVRRQLCAELVEARLNAEEEQAEIRLRLGQHRDLVEVLTGRLEVDPARERTAGQLALALYRSDQSSQALDVCRRTRRHLHDELGIDPGPSLRELEVAILRNDASLAAPAAARPRPVVALPSHLPAEPAGFTGRAVEVRRLTELLSGAPTTVTVTVISGVAGAGKTALAVHCAHQVSTRYPDGQLYVDLQGYHQSEPMRPVDALALFLRALGVAPTQVPADENEAVLLYRSRTAGRRVLVVLDNASSADQVRPLLPGAAGSAVLVTSRDDLRGLTALDSAVPLRLDTLTPMESLTLLSRVLGTSRVESQRGAAEDLARLCGHLPLALRIAAAHLAARPTEPIETYVRALDEGNRLGMLAIPEDSRAAVETAFDLSYRTLTADHQHLFGRLGLVPGPDFTAAVAAVLTGLPVPDTETGLDRLEAAHLVRRHAPGRYRLHDLLRLYAIARATDKDVHRLLAYYLHNADAAARRLYPHKIRLPLPAPPPGLVVTEFPDTGTASRWLDSELPNVIAAIHFCAREGHHQTLCLLADTLRGYFYGRGFVSEWLAVATAARQAASDPMLACAAELSLGDAYSVRSRHAQAREHHEAARSLARQAGWLDAESTALGTLGVIYRESGRLRAAIDSFTEALEINVRQDQPHKQVLDLVNLGGAQAMLGDLRQAAESFRRAWLAGRRVESPSGTAMVLQCLGNTDRLLGKLTDATGHVTEALALYRGTDDVLGQASALDSLASIHADAGRYREARQTATEALELARKIDSLRVESAALNTLGTVHHLQGEPSAALACHSEAHQIAVTAGLSSDLDALVGIANANVALGSYAEASSTANLALSRALETGHRLLEGQALSALALNALAVGAEAVSLARQALAVHRETGYRLGIARTLRTLGDAVCQVEGTRSALPHWQEAVELFTGIGSPEAIELRRKIKAE
ncbi:BTAD domain-containing putative transcriptional regulator [Kibdelosporangium persicum]|uniref:Pathway specific regulator n=1 Tax=Kibdelosporangium persicum TaxID=2698649 RepID=A0ABX2FE07_9PSEU|nr:Pathway specific regulator [Kibdelosporangium persicum]